MAAPADDAAITGCSAAWGSLSAQLLPAQATGGSMASLPAADPPAIHVVVCEPEGVRGAAAVLGGSTPPVTAADGSGGGSSGTDASAAAGTILLRRSAMWLSHTSLVHQVGPAEWAVAWGGRKCGCQCPRCLHPALRPDQAQALLSMHAAWPTPLQLGHFLGLPHPFPDERQTCKLDGDAIADTPLQYAPNQGCEPGAQGLALRAGDAPAWAAPELLAGAWSDAGWHPRTRMGLLPVFSYEKTAPPCRFSLCRLSWLPRPADGGDLHVCQDSADGPLPVTNFMDLTNDTCR